MNTYSDIQQTDTRATLEIGDRTGRTWDIVAWGLVAIYAFLSAGRSIAPDVFGALGLLPVVLLPVVFLVVHGVRVYGVRTTLVFGAIVFVVSNVFENLSIATGFPFGNYYYGENLGQKLFDVPLLIGPAYLGMGYLSWTLARLLVGRTQGALTGASLIAVPAVASFLMVAWDLTFDPVASTIIGSWIWEQGGSYFGVPFGNFLGWFLTAFVFFTLFAAYLSRRAQASTVPTTRSGQYWLQAVAFYVAAAIPALLRPLTESAVGAVTDPAGTVWQGTDIYLGVALVALFTMVPFAVIAGLRALDLAPAEARGTDDGLPHGPQEHRPDPSRRPGTMGSVTTNQGYGDTMNILVLGAAGKTGREVVAQALAAGHTVTAFVRDRAKLERNDVPVAIGDARSVDDLRTALLGQDAVISTLGTGLGGNQKLIESSTQAVLEAMRSTRVKRLVMLSTFAASPTYRATGVMKLASIVMKGIVTDKTAGETLLKRSGIDWTIVYATRLTDEPRSGGYRTVEGTLTRVGTISRADLADALLSTLSDPNSVRQSRVVTSRLLEVSSSPESLRTARSRAT